MVFLLNTLMVHRYMTKKKATKKLSLIHISANICFLEDLQCGDIQHGPIAAEHSVEYKKKATTLKKDHVGCHRIVNLPKNRY